MSDWEEEDDGSGPVHNAYVPPRGRGWYDNTGSDGLPDSSSRRPGFGRGRADRFGRKDNYSPGNRNGFYRDGNSSGVARGEGGFGRQHRDAKFTRGDNSRIDDESGEKNSSYHSNWRDKGNNERSRGFYRDRAGHGRERNSSVMMVPSDDVRYIIGKGGQKIRELQEQSGAYIKIKNDDATYSETPVEISGSDDAIKKAKELIEQIVSPESSVANGIGGMSMENDDTCERHEPPPPPKPIPWAKLREEKEQREAARWADLPPIKKVFYQEQAAVANMDEEEVEKFRSDNNKIMVENYGEAVQDRAIPNPIRTFEEAYADYPEILDEMHKAGFERPSPIQCQSWPVIMSGMDLIGIAQTGTGKTLAFLLPAFLHIDGQDTPRNRRGGPTVLVLSPTRELALQIEAEVKKFHYRGIKSVCVYGGGSRKGQIQVVQKGVEIVIATPGRLNDLLMNEIMEVRSVTYLVLDEADRMLDMGFEPEIKKILLDIRPDRQTIMTSATWPKGVQRMADQYMNNPVRVFVGSLDLNACHSVTQLVEVVDPADKKERTLDFIAGMSVHDKLLIFVGKKVKADDIASDFMLAGIQGVQCIHGDREQVDREQALDDFKTGRAKILIATDVASRGLDIRGVTCVLNFDFPRNIEDYVHRIGRTGRAGKKGTSLTFVTRDDWRQAHKLINIMVEANQEVPDELADMAERYQEFRDRNGYSNEGGGRGGRRGGGGDGCYNCGGSGHFALNSAPVVTRDGSDVITGKNLTRKRRKRNFIPSKRYWWRGKSIPYMLDKSLGVTGRKAFNAAIADFEKNTCIRFIKHTNEKDYIWVHHGSGCSSTTGKSGGKQTLTLGKGCRRKGIIIHELLHSLGMMHEHCRADRDHFIKINFDNIKPKERIEFQIWKGYTSDEPYDYGSVMHYGYYFFSLNRKIPTIVKLMPGGPPIGQRKGFSDIDLRKVNKVYKCRNYTKPKPKPQMLRSVEIVSGDCGFERGFCNWKNWRNKVEDQFDWKIGRLVDAPYFGNALRQPMGSFIFFKKPRSRTEYMSSGVLHSGFFNGSCCLRFFYLMNTGGHLRVFIKEAESNRRNPFVLIWQKAGRQGNWWRKMETFITGTNKPYKIYIEGIKTPQLTGILAVDEVCVAQGVPCGCKYSTTV